MAIESLVFGARADVYLEYHGDIRALADLLSKELIHVPLEVEARESPPHDLIGMCETLGFEVWLERAEEQENAFRFRFETEHSFQESFNGQMHDLSLWLARYLFAICKIHTLVKLEDGSEVRFEG